MTSSSDEAVVRAREALERARRQGDPTSLATSLEAYATATLEQADFDEAAVALEEAAELWAALGQPDSQGKCLLLAASSYRLGTKEAAADRVLYAGLAAPLPPRLRHAFELERCEQHLAGQRYESALRCFTDVLEQENQGDARHEPHMVAHLLQRRAAAFVSCERFTQAADDLIRASAIYRSSTSHADAEACALAAAAVLAEVDPEAAERIMAGVLAEVPRDGGAAVRRGLVGGKIAMKARRPDVALTRFDGARQGALDATDPIAYLAAAVEASHAAETAGRHDVAYARLATAWATMSDLVGRDAAHRLVSPSLGALRDRLGGETFSEVKRQYEAKQRDSARA